LTEEPGRPKRSQPKRRTPKKVSKPKKALEKKKPARRAEQVKPKKPTPVAMVMSSGSVRKLRVGRGFSLQELKAVNLDLNRVRRWGLRVDIRRASERGENIDALKKWIGIGEKPKALVRRRAPSKRKSKG